MKTRLIAVVFMFLAVAAIAGTPLRPYPTTYEVFTGTSGAGTTHTLAKVSYDCIIIPYDTTTTNTITVKFNGSATALTMYATDTLSVTDFPIKSVTVAAGTGTPTYRIICFEQQ